MGLFFEEPFIKNIMEDNKPGKQNETTDQQAAQGRETHINPFRNAAPEESPQQRTQEEIELEQQRKEAMTERD